jgi:predicted deacylase
MERSYRTLTRWPRIRYNYRHAYSARQFILGSRLHCTQLTGEFAIEERRGASDGPTVAVVAGVHGDEEEGVLAVQRVLHRLAGRPLARGTLRAVAVAHPAAYAAHSRVSPFDGLNLARCFPGRPDGTATERLAHRLVERVIRGADALVDLHSAGSAYAMPFFCGYSGDGTVRERSRQLAAAFGAPIVWRHEHPPSPGRTIAAACELGIPSVYAECTGGAALSRTDVEAFVAGVMGVLSHLGMLRDPMPAPTPRWFIDGGVGDVDGALVADRSGRFVCWREAGDPVDLDGLIGEVVDDAGHVVRRVTAPHEGLVVFLRRHARVQAGDALCSFAPRPRPWALAGAGNGATDGRRAAR